MELDPTNPDITAFVALVEKELAERDRPEVEPLPSDTHAVTPSPRAETERELIKAASVTIQSLDSALQGGDADKFLSLLSTELADAERDNLADFVRLAKNVKVERTGAPDLQKRNQDGSVQVVWPYRLSYEMAGQKIEQDVQMTYLMARSDTGALTVLRTAAALPAKK